ncbi:MAG: DUF6370 family protein [Ferruginibacter sp.]|nr:hypothetical protein [Ferruginibacter sp.]
MKYFFVCIALLFYNNIIAQQATTKRLVFDSTKSLKRAEISCGQCQFKMEGKGCNLAIRVNNKTYYIDGTGIDDYGDAHAADGFCEAIKKAKVQGEVVKGRFVLSYIEFIDDEKK